MRIARVVFVCAALLLLSNMATPPVYGQSCACSCAWVCDNRCQFNCTNCSVSEQINNAQECCNAAHQATGDTGACGEGGPEF